MNKPIIEIKDNVVKYDILWYKNIYFTLEVYNIIKDHIGKSTLNYFWTKTKHLLSQNELYFYFGDNTDFTIEIIIYIITKIIHYRSNEYLENILTSRLDYLTNKNIIYHKYIHSVTYFWLLFLSSSIYFFKSYGNKNYFDSENTNIYNLWIKLYSKYSKIFDTLENFGILSINDDFNDIDTYPIYPSKTIINQIKTNIINN